MKNQTVLASLLLLFAGFVASIAQQTAHSYPPKTDKIFRHQQEKYDDSFNQDPLSWQTSALNTHSIDDLNIMNAIIPDFQVNENTSSRGANQSYPDIAMSNNGNYIIVWDDALNGDKDIYAQRYYADGSKLGTHFKVNDDQTSLNQERPAIAANSRGEFAITWMDERNGEYHIYAQCYSQTGSPLGANIKVSENPSSSYRHVPDISKDENGNFIITWWISDREGDIYAQRFDKYGNRLGTKFRVNDDPWDDEQFYPAISCAGNGRFVITWVDQRFNYSNIFAQRFSFDGLALGKNFRVNDVPTYAVEGPPAISLDDSANFCITWMDNRDGNSNIYAQRYDLDGNPIGANFKVNDDSGSRRQGYPSVSLHDQGNFIICWEDGRNGHDDIYAQHYARDGSPKGINFKINDDTTDTYQWDPVVTFDRYGNFVISWWDERQGEWDIFAQQFSTEGHPIESNFKVNEDSGSALQEYSSLAVDGSGNFVITWVDERYGDPDIYAQRYSSSAEPLGVNFKVNDDLALAEQQNPVIASDEIGNFVIAWIDESDTPFIGDIYAQIYDYVGNKIGTNFKLNDELELVRHEHPAITSGKDGEFIITWQDDRREGFLEDIYAQRFDSEGRHLGSNFKVNDDLEVPSHWDPSISSDSFGNFVIAWTDGRDFYGDIYAQRFDSEGNPVGANFRVNDDPLRNYQYSSTVTCDAVGNFVIAWSDRRDYFTEIYAQRFTRDGVYIDSNFVVQNNQEFSYLGSPLIASDKSGNFIISWYKLRNTSWGNSDIYAKRFNSDGRELGSEFRVTSTDYKNQIYPDIKLWQGRIYSTWTDSRAGGSGYDIWANILDWDNPQPKTEPEGYTLYQNYPNPFNQGTTIEIYLPLASQVKLTVFNILGQQVATLISGSLPSGFHAIPWQDSSGIASGVYIYRLEAGTFTETKKMVLMR